MKVFKLNWNDRTANIFDNKMILGTAGIILMIYTGLTFNRNFDWKDSFTLYEADIEKAPNSAKLNFHYGLELVKKGNENERERTKMSGMERQSPRFEKALEIKPNYHDAFGQLGMSYYREKNYEKAIENYELALKYRNNRFALVHSNMGIIYFERGDMEKAQECYEKSSPRRPDNG